MKSVLYHAVVTLVIFAILSNVTRAQGAVGSASDGGADGVLCGTYNVLYDNFAAASLISPDANGESINGDLGIDISGDINTNVKVSISLPTTLVGSSSHVASITFPSSGAGSGVHVETSSFFNPQTVNFFNLGSGGTATLRLGYILTIPSNVSVGEAFTGQVTFTINDTVNVVCTITINASSFGCPPAPTGNPVDGGVDGALCGPYFTEYHYLEANTTISPDINGETPTGDLGVDIFGVTGTSVKVSISLPSVLVGVISGKQAPITFPSTGPSSGVDGETGNNFDPHAVNYFTFGSFGAVYLRLGYSFTLPSNNGDSFQGNITFTINDTLLIVSHLTIDTSPAECLDCIRDTLLINTGWDNDTNSVIPTGAVDNDWYIVSDPDINTTEKRPASVIPAYNPSTAWANPQANSQWISSYPTSENDKNGLYQLEYYFCLEDTLNASLCLSIRADDTASVYLNGNMIGSTGTYSFGYWKNPVTLCTSNPGFFTIGKNTIRVDLRNTQQIAMGVNIVGSVTGQIPKYFCCCSDSTSGIMGKKWNDANGNGLWDAGEQSMRGWQINLSNGMSAVTDTFGNYYFLFLPQGSYTVTEGSNPEWIQTAPASGSYTINLNSCQIVDSINFANRMRACTPPPSGMVAWWTLKETGGTAFQDDAGIHNNGTSSGGPTLATGKVSNARSFDGSDDYIEVPDHAELNFGTGDFSFDAWIKTTDSNSVKVFLDKRVSSPAYRGYEIFLFNGILHIQLSDGTSDNYGSGTFVADNQWHHIAITVDRDTANGIAFYVDGALVANANPTNHSGTLTNSSPLRLGSDIAGGGTPFNGTLDEIELFSRILTPTEVRSLWEADTAGKCMTVDSCLNFGTINPCLCSCKTVTTTGAVTPTSCASGNESYGQLIINAAPNSSLLLACSIPTQLINGSNTIPLSNMTASYSTTGVSGTFTSFDPFAGTTVTTGSTGDVIVRFGGRICPLRNLPGGEYTGYLLLTWKYTGTLTPTTNDLGLCITADIIDENCCVTAPPNLSNWWSLDETSGTTSADRKGFPNTGTHVNSPTPVAGKVEGALDFNGVDQYIEVPDHNDLDVGVGDFTIDAWVKTTSTAAFSIILDKRIASPTQGYSFFLIDGVWFLQLADASGGSDVCGPTANCMNYSSTIFVSDGAWHHLAVTVDRNNPSGIIFYFDGIASGVTADPTGQANSLSNSAPLRIGTRSFDLNNPFRGQLDEIEIFKRALTPSEILSLYFADSLGKCKRDIVDDSYDVVINPKWNIVSVPVVAPDFTKTTLFPDALSVAFTFDGAYAPAPTLDNAHGYWIKFGDTATTNLTGTPIFANSYPLNAGWNMVASLGAPVDVSSPSQVALMTMPEGIISSSFFGYNNGYSVASSLEPGKGYWVKTDEDGILSLEASVDLGKQAAQPEQLALSQLKKLTFKDAVQNGQTLYFGNNPGENFKQSLYDLPPMPPQGVFDIRFASQRMAEIYPDNENRVQEYVINLTSVTYPLDITFDVPETQREKITLVAMFDGKVIKKYTLRNNEKITIENQSVNRIVLKTTTQTIIPTQYTLYQCYPNPFNPSTMIDFDIPANSYVTLKVYDVIGREVVTILNHEQYDAGRYQKVFNANNLASGLYFYRITAVGQDGILSYTDIKKMVLLK